MKTLPTIVASRSGARGWEVVCFDGMERIRNHDAVGYYFTLRDQEDTTARLGIAFSGTVMAVRPAAFGLPEVPDRETAFVDFGLAAIGDHIEADEALEPATPGSSAQLIECYSPAFQAWADRKPASDDDVENYLRAHLFWAWKMEHEHWELSSSDALRLRRPIASIQRLVRLGEGVEWEVLEEHADHLLVRALDDLVRRMRSRKGSAEEKSTGSEVNQELESDDSSPPAYVYVDELRISELRRLDGSPWDLRKLLSLCEELNQCYRSQCYHAVAALTRALIDHVPPIFGAVTFAEVANSHDGGKSFKECMIRLQEAGRRIADMHLHQHVRKRESLPTRTQVDFSNEIDMLLAELIRLLEKPESGT